MFFLIFSIAFFSLFDSAVAEEAPPSQSIRLEFTTEHSNERWVAKAYQKSLESFVGGFSKLQLEVLPESSVDYLWTGRLTGNKIFHEIIETTSGSVVSSGSFEQGISKPDLQIEALSTLRVLIRNGGLVDQWLAKLNTPTQKIPNFVALLGGLAWGYLILLMASFVFGSLHGLERIWHWNILQYFQSWMELSLAKLFLLVIFFLPAWIVAVGMNGKMHGDSFSFWFLTLPSLFLLQTFVIALGGLMMARLLDRKLVKGRSRTAQAWHWEISNYFNSYCKRLGLDLPKGLMKRMSFVPGRHHRTYVYGGGFGKVRIVVPYHLLELALGEPELHLIDEDERPPESPNLSLGRVLPRAWAATSSEKPSEKKIDQFLHRSRRALTFEAHLNSPDGGGQIPMESSAGVWGQVRPQKDAQSVGLISDNLQDLKVVKELLSEHHMMFAKLQFDEEYDDSDPSDYDFLFGLLLYQVGFAHRNESLFLTYWLGLQRLVMKTSEKFQMAFERATDFFETHFSRHLTVIQDSYVALHHGRHHLAQYLYLQLTANEQLLTSHASQQKLFHISKKIFEQVSMYNPSEHDLRKNRATPKNRMIWFSKHFAFELPEYKYKKRRPILSTAIAGLAVLTLFVEILVSLQYAPDYQKRKTEALEKIELKEKSDVAE